ncbi:MAG: DUF4058 family protein [Caldilineaceae bacterium]|nr:DUF4058 family protein [Caldilineaceae bacterium]
MQSPFPGMDPYLEQSALWGGFHNTLAAVIQAQLNPYLRPRYFARSVPHVTYESLEISLREENRSRVQTYPDVAVVYKQHTAPSRQTQSGVTITPAPVESEIIVDPLYLYSVEIYAAATEQLVTAIEILSPVNKRPGAEAQERYLRKRQRIFSADTVHLIEIDLLRGGSRPPLAQPVPDAPYYVVLAHAAQRPKVQVWPIQLTDLLPVLPVPLLPTDADVPLDLQHAVETVYEQGAFDLQIDYTQTPPPPPLSTVEQGWARDLLSPH